MKADQERQKFRKWAKTYFPGWEDFLTIEQERLAWWRGFGLDIPDNGRFTIHPDQLNFRQINNWMRENLSQLLKISCMPGSLLQSIHDVRQLGDKNWFKENNPSSADKRERPVSITFSVAAEDLIFSSDFSSFRSCHSIFYGSDGFSGGGRFWARFLNSAITFREEFTNGEPKLVGPDHHQRKKDSGQSPFAGVPMLPYRVGRRLIFGDLETKSIFFSRQYGTIAWQLIQLIIWIQSQERNVIGDLRSLDHTSRNLFKSYIDTHNIGNGQVSLSMLEAKVKLTKETHPAEVVFNSSTSWADSDESYQCIWCEDEEVAYREELCDNCNENTFMCPNCNNRRWINDSEEVIINYDPTVLTWCEHCIHNEAFACDTCDELFALSLRRRLGDERTRCIPCYESQDESQNQTQAG